MKELQQILDFIVEIEKLKNIHRKTTPVGLDRVENSAEHSWHVCLSALMLKDYANDLVDIERVIRMLLVHDLGEIDAGDTIIYASETKELKEKEAAGLLRILSFLPEEKIEEYFELWKEFEAGETDDAKFAKAIDRVPPILHNLYGPKNTWLELEIPKEKVFSVNSRIAQGSEKLWELIESKLEQAVSEGALK